MEVRVNYQDIRAADILARALQILVQRNRKVLVVCIGDNKVPGDAFGPVVGSLIADLPIGVVGTLQNIVGTTKLRTFTDIIPTMYPGYKIIAVDAAVGPSVGYIAIRNKPLKPRGGLGEALEEIGDISVIGVTADPGMWPFLSLLWVNPVMVNEMAMVVAKAFRRVFAREAVLTGANSRERRVLQLFRRANA